MQAVFAEQTHRLMAAQKDHTNLSLPRGNYFWAHMRRFGIVLPQKAKLKAIFNSIPLLLFLCLLQGCVVCWLPKKSGRGAPKSNSK